MIKLKELLEDIIDQAFLKATPVDETDEIEEKFNIRKQSCKQSDGDAGTHVISYRTKKGKMKRACHTSKKQAQDQVKAIKGPRR